MPRSHHAQIDLPVSPEEAFAALITPSAVRSWWSASRVIVVPEEGGMWMATWGGEEDAPDYVSGATLSTFEPPRRLVMSNMKYVAHTGRLPFEADLPTEFTIEPTDSGCRLHVHQTGFPDDPIADEHYRGCEIGWEKTLASLQAFLSKSCRPISPHFKTAHSPAQPRPQAEASFIPDSGSRRSFKIERFMLLSLRHAGQANGSRRHLGAPSHRASRSLPPGQH